MPAKTHRNRKNSSTKCAMKYSAEKTHTYWGKRSILYDDKRNRPEKESNEFLTIRCAPCVTKAAK